MGHKTNNGATLPNTRKHGLPDVLDKIKAHQEKKEEEEKVEVGGDQVDGPMASAEAVTVGEAMASAEAVAEGGATASAEAVTVGGATASAEAVKVVSEGGKRKAGKEGNVAAPPKKQKLTKADFEEKVKALEADRGEGKCLGSRKGGVGEGKGRVGGSGGRGEGGVGWRSRSRHLRVPRWRVRGRDHKSTYYLPFGLLLYGRLGGPLIFVPHPFS